MKIITILLSVVFCLAAESSAFAAAPADSNGLPFGDGFPNGQYYTLNIISKHSKFTCPQPEYSDGVQVYGNVIFTPAVHGNGPVTVLMEKGDKEPREAQETTTLYVTDWCTEGFPDREGDKGDGAVLSLPQTARGYAVYAGVDGRPGAHAEPAAALVPALFYVDDEAGNDLILLGVIDLNGAEEAIDLTPLFEWTGEVCYVQPEHDVHCQGECSITDLCCVDANMDYTFERCDLLTDVGEIFDGTALRCPVYNIDGIQYVPLSAQCNSYENEWVFNIGALADHLRDLDTAGPHTIQVRFYPVNE